MEDTFVINLANHCFWVKQSVDAKRLESDGCVVCRRHASLEQEMQARGMPTDDLDKHLLVIKDDGLYDHYGLVMPLVDDVELVISNYFL